MVDKTIDKRPKERNNVKKSKAKKRKEKKSFYYVVLCVIQSVRGWVRIEATRGFEHVPQFSGHSRHENKKLGRGRNKRKNLVLLYFKYETFRNLRVARCTS